MKYRQNIQDSKSVTVPMLKEDDLLKGTHTQMDGRSLRDRRNTKHKAGHQNRSKIGTGRLWRAPSTNKRYKNVPIRFTYRGATKRRSTVVDQMKGISQYVQKVGSHRPPQHTWIRSLMEPHKSSYLVKVCERWVYIVRLTPEAQFT